MLPHPGFEIPDPFLQLRDRCPLLGDHRLLLGDCRPKLNNQCLQGGDHGWHHSTERASKPTRHPTAVNGYGHWYGTPVQDRQDRHMAMNTTHPRPSARTEYQRDGFKRINRSRGDGDWPRALAFDPLENPAEWDIRKRGVP